ncbi:MAG: hypothetical protein HOY71_15985, partial [Nonomuraea sp.]|nr:hypothetical protein [Nonomuraea sp.]
MGDDEEELVRLRAELARLRSGRWRAWVASLLIVLGCVLMPLSAVGVWAANEVSDTDRYVANVAPLSQDPAVQSAVTRRATDEIMARLPVKDLLDQALGALNLPPKLDQRLQTLAGPVTAGVSGFVSDTVERVVTSDAFTTFWREANQVAHTQLVAVLSGEGSNSLKVDSDSVTLDLGPLIAKVKQALVARGFGMASAIPDVHPSFTLVQNAELAKYQGWYQLLTTLKWVLPILGLVLIALGVYVAKSHRRALVGAGVGLVVSMAVLWLGIVLGRARFLNAITTAGFDRPAAESAFELLTRFLVQGVRTVLVVGVVVAVAGYFTGPAPAAVGTRNVLTGGIARLRGGLDTGRVGTWVGRYRRALEIAASVVAGAIFVLWDHP